MLESLPEELICEILSKIPPAESYTGQHLARPGPDAKILSKLCLTSKKLRRLTRPILYTYFIVDGNQYLDIRLFLRTIFEQPELAKHLRYLHYEEDYYCLKRCTEDPEVIRLLEQKASEVSADFGEIYHDSFRYAMDHETDFLLLVCYALNVEELVLCALNQPSIERLGNLLAESHHGHANSLKILTRLRSLSLGRGYTEDPMVLFAEAKPLLRLPTLEAIELAETEFFHIKPATEIQEMSPAIRRLDIHSPYFQSDAELITFLGQFNSLKILYLALSADSSFPMEDFLKALSAFQDSLENLNLLLHGDVDSPSIDSFRSFTRLKYLEIDGKTLIGQD